MGPKTTDSNEKTAQDHFFRIPTTKSTKNNLDPSAMPTQQDIDIVRTSWERVVHLSLPDDAGSVSPAQGFGLAFYDALFDLDPHVRSLFGTNVLVQAKMLTYVIAYIARAPMLATVNSPPHETRSRKSSSSSPRPPCKMYTIKEINARKREQQSNPTNDDEEEDLDPEWLVMKLRELGARHHFYKVNPEQFQLVGPAIDTALRVRLQDEYTDEIGKAWTKTHGYVAHHMALGLLSQRQWEKKKSSSSILQRSPSSNNCILQ